ncbi:MAG: oligosaccharide flippase family protein [Candidatus Dormibacteraeota bacterium]|nr:oligosaccharide flippase family protein [Candidatus Dormibacteraeota bacterium]
MSQGAPAGSVVRRSVVSLFVSNAVSFAALGASYLLYSRLLSPAQFGLYSTAVVIGQFGQLLLDGGIKNTIIKAPTPPSRQEQGTVVALMAALSLLLVGGLAAGGGPITHFYPAAGQDYTFLAAFGAMYLLSYPWLAMPTAFLERRFDYRRLAFIESIAQVLERCTPAALLALTPLGMSAFLVGVLLGRGFRVAAVNLGYRSMVTVPGWSQVRDAAHLIREGGWLQLGVVASQIRDSLHVLIVGPLFGQAWVGYYGWSMQLSLICSQAFVQISARVSVPVFAQSGDFEARWRHCLAQVRVLTALTGPILVAALLLVPSVNAHLFHNRWQPALAILPLIFLRMLPGLATTPVGTLVMVDRGGRRLTATLVLWTLVEVVVALALVVPAGSSAVAWSYGITAWVGLWIMLQSLRVHGRPLLLDSARAILARPGLGVAAGLGALLAAALLASGGLARPHYALLLGPVVLIVAAAYAAEPRLRRLLRRPRERPAPPSRID